MIRSWRLLPEESKLLSKLKGNDIINIKLLIVYLLHILIRLFVKSIVN